MELFLVSFFLKIDLIYNMAGEHSLEYNNEFCDLSNFAEL